MVMIIHIVRRTAVFRPLNFVQYKKTARELAGVCVKDYCENLHMKVENIIEGSKSAIDQGSPCSKYIDERR